MRKPRHLVCHAKKLQKPNCKKKQFKNPDYVCDSYTQNAKKEGYRARSVYKLRQIDELHHLLRPGMQVLELGAAPGSWSRYALKQMKTGGTEQQRKGWLCCLDLQPIDKLLQKSPGLHVFCGDFTDTRTQQNILQALQQRGAARFDLIMSDMAPKTSGNRTVDSGASEALVEAIIAVLPLFLAPGGNLLFKLFQGGGENTLERTLCSLFVACERIRPQAVRSQSFEIYFLCKGYQVV